MPEVDVTAQPREITGWPRRWWKSKGLLARLVFGCLLGIATFGGCLFFLTMRRVGAATATDIALGLASPFAKHAGAQGVALAVAGYLALPAVAGAVAGAVMSAALQRLNDDLRRRSNALKDPSHQPGGK